ncbi:DUF4019 domain-containing protein [Thalassotalea sp. M1531]|uniref:DUF4019 domain-containing protein n=1 Tax=Thalassotalea algicola TaxID=2716224 RepID=A0A7Y0LAX0_9GAMM|nr:DUF4019 domain-containing protein [Thalassotalea algicola]NMP31061.1 DUF4019 domain-containing protein [Thalassotalea algicola]
MKFIFVVLLSILSSSFTFSHAGNIDAANTWLEKVDSGQYKESWQDTAPYFQQQITKEKWHTTLTAVRTPLNDVISRKLIDNSAHTSLPGAPDGNYKVLIFSTSFTNKKQAIETLTLQKTANGWQTIGYFIK